MRPLLQVGHHEVLLQVQHRPTRSIDLGRLHVDEVLRRLNHNAAPDDLREVGKLIFARVAGWSSQVQALCLVQLAVPHQQGNEQL